MYLRSVLALTASLLGLASSAPQVFPRVDRNLQPSNEEWEMAVPGGAIGPSQTWVTDRIYGDMDDIESLYIEASKAFNWVKKQKNVVTSNGNVLVAAFYDKGTGGIYASTIPRGDWQNLMMTDEKVGAVWRAHYNDISKERVDAEDGAYFWREIKKPMDLGGKDPLDIKYGQSQLKSSKMAVWGVYGTSPGKIANEKGQVIASCDGCKKMADALGVYWEDPQ